jgi:lipopolysaccharide biosynthesis glycosyltransferase
MLLSPDLDNGDADWFRNRGITVQHRAPFYDDATWRAHLHPEFPTPTIWTLKYHLFTEEFKQWENIVYLDADIMVRGSLTGLLSRGFTAVANMCNPTFNGQFASRQLDEEAEKQLAQFLRAYSLSALDFNAGVFSFETAAVGSDMVRRLDAMLRAYGRLSRFSEQCFMNLVFYNTWQRGPLTYNVCVPMLLNETHMRPSLIEGRILHFNGEEEKKPWDTRSPFYAEWQANLEGAEHIDFSKTPPAERRPRLLHEQLTRAVCLLEMRAKQKRRYRRLRSRLKPILNLLT